MTELELHIEQDVEDPRWSPYNLHLIEPIAQHVIKELKISSSLFIELHLVNDESIQVLNYTYRQKDKATNVLSFPAFDGNLNLSTLHQNITIGLGDIFLSFETIQKEKEDKKISFENHCYHLFLHGLLHLLGFDHQTDEEANIMETMEIKILSQFNIANPYEKV
ncbi:MAG: rRNA maturation RNase YbeY [Candidatus Puniceispirillum sp.]|nr:rRNA maturation RNase YbeY [Candidatus Pelagibacter sp.]MBA4282895.1 rRNA maturation RNase YbeY [Candidatus Puniceispirillum sp.]